MKISQVIFYCMIGFTPLIYAQPSDQIDMTTPEITSETISSEKKTYAQKPIIIENSNSVMSVPLKSTIPISAATPLKAIAHQPAMNIKAIIRNKFMNAKMAYPAIMVKYNHLLPMPIGAVTQKPILDAPIIAENSNAEKNSPLKSISNQIFRDTPVIIECAYSLISTPVDPEAEHQKRNPPLIQKRYADEFFPNSLYVLKIPTKEPEICYTPASCVPLSFHQHWCNRHPGECEKNLEKRKKIYAAWCKKYPLKCQQDNIQAKNEKTI